MVADEFEAHLGTSAKMPIAFFSTSRSMRVRSSSRFKRVISDAWSAGDGIGEAVDAVALDRTVPPRTAARQFRNIDGEMPNPVATCISGRPLLSNRATASHLNSGENSLLVFGICAPPRPHRLSKVSTESRDHHIQGGRTFLRRAIYMPALAAVRFNRDLKTKFDQLIADGKPAKVALVAIMRKLVVLANALLRDQRPWSEIRP